MDITYSDVLLLYLVHAVKNHLRHSIKLTVA